MQKTFDAHNWEDSLTVKPKWVERFFHQIPGIGTVKIKARALSLKFSGTQQECLALANYLADSISHYVFDQHQLASFAEEEITPYREAVKFFGNTDPVYDGKYGELLLYLLVEAILKAPLVCHKISLLTNVNDQVKGGDGIFFGKHGNNISIFIGESKIHQKLSNAINSSLESVDRFSKNYAASSIEHELFIARSNITKNFSLAQAKAIFEAFKPGTNEYSACNKVFPILLVYDSTKINEIECDAISKDDAEKLIAEWIADHASDVLTSISSAMNGYPDLKKVFLEFFLIPMSDVGHFKKTLFKQLHGIEYKEVKVASEKGKKQTQVRRRTKSQDVPNDK